MFSNLLNWQKNLIISSLVLGALVLGATTGTILLKGDTFRTSSAYGGSWSTSCSGGFTQTTSDCNVALAFNGAYGADGCTHWQEEACAAQGQTRTGGSCEDICERAAIGGGSWSTTCSGGFTQTTQLCGVQIDFNGVYGSNGCQQWQEQACAAQGQTRTGGSCNGSLCPAEPPGGNPPPGDPPPPGGNPPPHGASCDQYDPNNSNWCNPPAAGTQFASPCDTLSDPCGADGVKTYCTGNPGNHAATGGCCLPVACGGTRESIAVGGPGNNPPPSDNPPPGDPPGCCDPNDSNSCGDQTCTISNGACSTGFSCDPNSGGGNPPPGGNQLCTTSSIESCGYGICDDEQLGILYDGPQPCTTTTVCVPDNQCATQQENWNCLGAGLDCVQVSYSAYSSKSACESATSCGAPPAPPPAQDIGVCAGLDPNVGAGCYCNCPAGYYPENNSQCDPAGNQQYCQAGQSCSCVPANQPNNSPIPGDTNGDGSVDVVDYATVVNYWGQTANNTNRNADLNGDGKIDTLDYTVLFDNWSNSNL